MEKPLEVQKIDALKEIVKELRRLTKSVAEIRNDLKSKSRVVLNN